jgi:hypothetical protein
VNVRLSEVIGKFPTFDKSQEAGIIDIPFLPMCGETVVRLRTCIEVEI